LNANIISILYFKFSSFVIEMGPCLFYKNRGSVLYGLISIILMKKLLILFLKFKKKWHHSRVMFVKSHSSVLQQKILILFDLARPEKPPSFVVLMLKSMSGLWSCVSDFVYVLKYVMLLFVFHV
jgi:hypothetical protein